MFMNVVFLEPVSFMSDYLLVPALCCGTFFCVSQDPSSHVHQCEQKKKKNHVLPFGNISQLLLLIYCRLFLWYTLPFFSHQYGFVGHWLSPGKETVGALDFGGASTQITFETKEKVEDKNNLVTLQLYGKNYSIYTHSFLCYGKDQMLSRLLAHLVEVNTGFATALDGTL